MTFELKEIVPWGRSFEEYVSMFSLNEADFNKKILGCGDGPAGFNADASRRGYQVVSVDPIYGFTSTEIKRRIYAIYNLDFHICAIEELLRVSWEVRIFPLLKLDSQRSQHLRPVVDYLEANDYSISIEKVSYEFQYGGNEMLKIMKTENEF